MGKFNGIPCQIQVCNEFSYLHLLDEGWFYTPEEVLEAEIKEKALEEEIPEEIPEEETPENDFGEGTEAEPMDPPRSPSTDDEIRTTAKKAGINYWHTKSIDRLVSEIGELNDAERSED